MRKTLSKWWHVFFGIETPEDELLEDAHWKACRDAYWEGFREGQESLWPLVKVLARGSKN